MRNLSGRSEFFGKAPRVKDEADFPADWRDFDRQVIGEMNVIAAHLHAILPHNEDIGVRTPQGILLERHVEGTRFRVRAGLKPLTDPITVDMAGTDEYRAVRDACGGFEWGPSNALDYPKDWKSHSHIMNRVGRAVVDRLKKLHAGIKSEYCAVAPDGRGQSR